MEFLETVEFRPGRDHLIQYLGTEDVELSGVVYFPALLYLWNVPHHQDLNPGQGCSGLCLHHGGGAVSGRIATHQSGVYRRIPGAGVYAEVKKRPLYIVSESYGFENSSQGS